MTRLRLRHQLLLLMLVIYMLKVDSFALRVRFNSIRHFSTTSIYASENDEQNDAHDSILHLLRPSTDRRIEQMSSTDLAYIGDAVFELLVRSKTVWPSKKTSNLQSIVVGLVRAEHQSNLLAKLRTDFDLTLMEQQVLSRGRNSSTNSSKNRRNPVAYQDATALEALIGYLFISDTRRCQELLTWIRTNLDLENSEQ
ncbi:hypothetical protein MPSEU_000229900 [Mayamaea pseudoterrestris]|nr:hypothetical protein MPSEU_000229900 [Mayamaea pseudoterrestris]